MVMASGLITFPILARYVGADGYGAYGQVNTIVAFVIPFAALGLGGAMVRFFSVQEWTEGVRNQFVKIVFFVVFVAGVVSLLMMKGAPMLNRFFLNWEQGTELFRWGALLIVFGAMEELLINLLRSRQKLVHFSLIQLSQTCMIIGVTFTLLPLGYGLVDLLKATLAIKVGILSVFFVGFWAWDRPLHKQTSITDVSMRRMIQFGLPVAIAGLGLWMMNLGNRLVIGHFLTAEALGLYGAVYAFSCLLVAVNAPLNLPLYPRLMRAIASGDSDGVAREVRMFHRYATLVLVPCAVFLVVIMKPLLLLMGGGSFHVDVLLVTMIVGAIFLDQWNSIAHYAVLCADQVAFSQNAWLITGALNVGGNLFAVPLFGLHGAAFVTLATFLLLEGMFFRKAREFVPLGFLYRFDVTLKAFLSSMVGAGIIWFWMGDSELTALKLIICTMMFGTIYLFSMILIREVGKSEVDLIANALFMKR